MMFVGDERQDDAFGVRASVMQVSNVGKLFSFSFWIDSVINDSKIMHQLLKLCFHSYFPLRSQS